MELKVCLCGREAVVVEYKSGFGINCKYSDPIVCVEEHEYFCHHLGTMDFPSSDYAIKFWNTRPLEDALRAEIETLKGKVAALENDVLFEQVVAENTRLKATVVELERLTYSQFLSKMITKEQTE